MQLPELIDQFHHTAIVQRREGEYPTLDAVDLVCPQTMVLPYFSEKPTGSEKYRQTSVPAYKQQ